MLNFDSYAITSERQWNDIIKDIDYSYFFHTPEWIKILENTFDYQNATVVYEIDNKKILVPLVAKEKFGFKFYSSLPYGYGGFIHDSGNSPEISKTILLDLAKGNVLRLNVAFPPIYQHNVVENGNIHKVISEWNYTHILNLTSDFKDIVNGFNQQTLRVYKKRTEIEIIKNPTLENFRIFYDLYAQETKKWGYQDPPHPLKLYENFFRYGAKNIQILLAKKDDTFIGGLIIFNFGKNILYWQSAFLANYSKENSIRYLFFDVIEQGCKDGYQICNLGASGNYDGTRQFKEGFGAKRVNLDHFQVLSKLGGLINKVHKI